MLRLSRMTDYGTLVMMHMAQAPEVVHSANDIAQHTKLPEPSVRKVLKIMVRSELLCSVRGLKGGYRLAKAPKEISLESLITALEGTTVAITDCCDDEQTDHCDQYEACHMRPHWAVINQSIRSALQGVTVQDLLSATPITTQNSTVAEGLA
ncbi:SUF system Fe-S cluster assembly regulator [Magnetococcus sp. PR-3]|uniref:SUF system Fe-S cluster assembly regulator n=1 Tax=Magnetococcus sp. PR-3 TaxID=3120355 RepID=UPI002FCE44C7